MKRSEHEDEYPDKGWGAIRPGVCSPKLLFVSGALFGAVAGWLFATLF